MMVKKRRRKSKQRVIVFDPLQENPMPSNSNSLPHCIFLAMFVWMILAVTIKTTTGREQHQRHNNNANEEMECADLVLHHHPVHGFGVYAGRNYTIGEYLEIAPHVVMIEQERFQDTALMDYVEEINDTYASIAFGYSLLFNHIYPYQARSVDKYIDYNNDSGGGGDIVSDPSTPVLAPTDGDTVTTSTMIPPSSTAAATTTTTTTNAGPFPTITTTITTNITMFTMAAKNITKGSQIFMWYGDDWFDGRTEPELFPQILGGEYFHLDDPYIYHGPSRVPGCPQLTTRISEGKLYAAQYLPKGTVVEVARVLLLPLGKVIGSGELESLVWWKSATVTDASDDDAATCQSVGSSKVILPLGRGVYYQPAYQQSITTDIDNDDTMTQPTSSKNATTTTTTTTTAAETAATPTAATATLATKSQPVRRHNIRYEWWFPRTTNSNPHPAYSESHSGNNQHNDSGSALRERYGRVEERSGDVDVDITTDDVTDHDNNDNRVSDTHSDSGSHLHIDPTILSNKQDQLTQSPCGDRMFVSFTTIRDVEVGEELTIDAVIVKPHGSNRATMNGDGDRNNHHDSGDSNDDDDDDDDDDGGNGDGSIFSARRPRKQLRDSLFSSYCM